MTSCRSGASGLTSRRTPNSPRTSRVSTPRTKGLLETTSSISWIPSIRSTCKRSWPTLMSNAWPRRELDSRASPSRSQSSGKINLKPCPIFHVSIHIFISPYAAGYRGDCIAIATARALQLYGVYWVVRRWSIPLRISILPNIIGVDVWSYIFLPGLLICKIRWLTLIFLNGHASIYSRFKLLRFICKLNLLWFKYIRIVIEITSICT